MLALTIEDTFRFPLGLRSIALRRSRAPTSGAVLFRAVTPRVEMLFSDSITGCEEHADWVHFERPRATTDCSGALRSRVNVIRPGRSQPMGLLAPALSDDHVSVSRARAS